MPSTTRLAHPKSQIAQYINDSTFWMPNLLIPLVGDSFKETWSPTSIINSCWRLFTWLYVELVPSLVVRARSKHFPRPFAVYSGLDFSPTSHRCNGQWLLFHIRLHRVSFQSFFEYYYCRRTPPMTSDGVIKPYSPTSVHLACPLLSSLKSLLYAIWHFFPLSQAITFGICLHHKWVTLLVSL